jgi:hypothetical protein
VREQDKVRGIVNHLPCDFLGLNNYVVNSGTAHHILPDPRLTTVRCFVLTSNVQLTVMNIVRLHGVNGQRQSVGYR